MLKDPWQSKWRFFETVLPVLVELGPAVVFFEDATHLDEASVALTRYLIQHDRQLPLLIIAACRDSTEGIPWLSAFRADEAEVLTLCPLSTDATRVLLTNLLDGPVSDAGVSTVHTRSSGIPLYIEVIANLLREEGEFHRGPTGEWQYKSSMKARPLSPTLTTLFAQRLGKLSEKSSKSLAFAALIDAEFDFDTWLALLGGERELDAALDVLDEALGLRILRETDQNRFIFHPIDIAQVLTASLTPPRRRHFHPRIAQVLSDRGGDPTLIAHHYEKADMAPEAARHWEAAGAKAMMANAINQAISHYERAIALDASQESYEALGNLYHQHGASTESIDAYEKALELAREATDVTSQSRILNNLSFVHCMYDHYSDAYQTASAVLKLPGISEVESASAQSNLGFISWSVGRLIEAEKWCLMAVDNLEKHGDEVSLATACSRLGLAHFSRGKFPEAKAAIERSLAIRRRQGFYWDQAYCLNNLGKVAIEQGDFEDAESLLNSAQQLFEKIENPDGLATVYRNRGRALLRQGEPIEALPVLVEALELARKIKKERSPGGLNDIYLVVAEANIESGNLKWAKEALARVDTAGNQEFAARAQGLSAQILAAQGEYSDAQAMFKKALAMFEQVGHRAGLLRTKLYYARCLAAQGLTHSAAAQEREARDEADRIGLHL
jgi:tetratricopeptide (TPR) repeat protein